MKFRGKTYSNIFTFSVIYLLQLSSIKTTFELSFVVVIFTVVITLQDESEQRQSKYLFSEIYLI